MKNKDLQDQRGKTSKDLKKLVEDKKLELVKVKAEISAGKEKNLKKVKNLRKDMAQILTLIREKEIMGKEDKVEQRKGSAETRKG